MEYQNGFFFFDRQTKQHIKREKPKRAPLKSTQEVYKGRQNQHKKRGQDKNLPTHQTSYREHNKHLTKERSTSGIIVAQAQKDLKRKDFSLSNENCISSNTTLFLSIQIAHNKHKGAARHSFASFFLRRRRTQPIISSLTR